MQPSHPNINNPGDNTSISAEVFLGMDLKTLVGHCATLCTITLFLTGIEICRKIKSRGSTIDISALPFICGLASCSLWLRYGLLIHDTVLITVNLVGGILQVMYIMCYTFYAVHKDLFMKQLIGALMILGFLFLYTSIWIPDVTTAQKISGLAACSGSVIFMASPLSSLELSFSQKNTSPPSESKAALVEAHAEFSVITDQEANVLKTKSVESLPFSMILFSFMMSSLWVWYGILINDAFVQVPNFLGALVTGCQLCLFVIYPSKKAHLDSNIA